VLALAREGYSKWNISLRDTIDIVSYSGFWRFLGRHARTCFDEVRRSFSKELFCASLRKLVPEITVHDLETGGAGVRAQALDPQGGMVQDFHIIRQPGAVHILNAPSPAATASLAIGEEIAQQVCAVLQGS
jgi:L-2-hydroxyglutarate oxidase LhgO